MIVVRCVVAVVALSWAGEARPSTAEYEILALLEQEGAASSPAATLVTDLGDLTVIELVGELSEDMSVAGSGFSAVQTVGEGAQGLASDVWNVGSTIVVRLANATGETAAETLQGTQDAFRAANTFVANGVGAAGRLAVGAVKSSLGVARDAVYVTTKFVEDISKRVIDGVVETGGAVGDFVEAAGENTRDFVGAATDVMGRTVSRGVQHFATVPQPPLA